MLEITEEMAIEIRRVRSLRPVGSMFEHNISWRHIPEGVFYSVRVENSGDINEAYRAFLKKGDAEAYRVLIGG